MCDIAILENSGTLKSVIDYYKNQEMCNKVVDNYPYALEFVPGCFKTQIMCDKAVDTHPTAIKYVPGCYKTQETCNNGSSQMFFVFYSILDQYKIQEVCDIVVSLYSILIIYCLDRYIIEKMRDKAVDDSLAALKLIPDWFVTTKMIKKLDTALQSDDGLLFFDEDSGDVTFRCDKIGILNVNLSNINLDNNFDEDNLDILFSSDFWFGIVNLKNAKHLKEKYLKH